MPKRLPILTIGHSTLTLEAFAERMRAAEVAQVVDVRSITRSRTNPPFNQSTLPESLAPFGFAYTPCRCWAGGAAASARRRGAAHHGRPRR